MCILKDYLTHLSFLVTNGNPMLNKTIPREIPLPMEQFTYKYNVGRGAIWVRVSNGTLPKSVMLSMGVVNEAWFLRRFAFMNYVKELN